MMIITALTAILLFLNKSCRHKRTLRDERACWRPFDVRRAENKRPKPGNVARHRPRSNFHRANRVSATDERAPTVAGEVARVAGEPIGANLVRPM